MGFKTMKHTLKWGLTAIACSILYTYDGSNGTPGEISRVPLWPVKYTSSLINYTLPQCIKTNKTTKSTRWNKRSQPV